MNEEDLKFYNKQDKEELVIMCISKDNMLNKVEQENKQLKEELEVVKFNVSTEEGNATEYLERIDKAIETLENIPQIPNNYLELKRNYLLEILKGEE